MARSIIVKCYSLALSAVLAASVFMVGPSAQALPMNGVDITSIGWDMFGNDQSDSMIARMATDKANWVAFALLNTVDTTHDVVEPYDPSDPSQTGPNANLAHAVAVAQSHNLHVALKLHYTGAGGDTLANGGYSPTDKASFFRTYSANVMSYARFAQAHHVELLVIGTEMGGYITGKQNRFYFARLIRRVRSVYSGKLTYAATAGELPSYHYQAPASDCGWCQEYDEAYWLGFWDLLDYAGIDAYPMLTTQANPSLAVLTAALMNAPDFLEGTTERFNQLAHWGAEIARSGKPGIITETGAPSVTGAAYCTGCWPTDSQAPNQALQANIYAALMNSFSEYGPAANLVGVFPWANNAYNMWGGQPDTRGFTFASKRAETVIANQYAQ